MLRYRCSHCSQLLQAHELRAGKKSICSSCPKSHTIPADRSEWLNEAGESLHSRQTEAAAATHVSASAATATTETLPPVPEEPHATVSETNSPSTPTPPPSPSPIDTPPEREPVPEPEPEHTEVAAANEAMPVQTQAEIAATLTDRLARKMKPRREPRRDIPASTAGWLFFTGIATAFFLATLITGRDYSGWVIGFGLLEIFIAYAWIVFLTASRNSQRGIACAVPPITLYYLTQRKYARCRPLWLFLTGAVVVFFGALTSKALPNIQSWFASDEPDSANTAFTDPASLSHLEQLRKYGEQKSYDDLIQLLHTLATTDEDQSVSAKDRKELAAGMKKLCSHQDVSVRVAALAAYARWGGEDARTMCLNALSPDNSEEERERALELLPQWKDSEEVDQIAQNMAALIGGSSRLSARATESLIEIGGEAVERAALDRLPNAPDELTRLRLLSVIDEVGGDRAIRKLTEIANTTIDQAIKARYHESIRKIQLRQKQKAK